MASMPRAVAMGHGHADHEHGNDLIDHEVGADDGGDGGQDDENEGRLAMKSGARTSSRKALMPAFSWPMRAEKVRILATTIISFQSTPFLACS